MIAYADHRWFNGNIDSGSDSRVSPSTEIHQTTSAYLQTFMGPESRYMHPSLKLYLGDWSAAVIEKFPMEDLGVSRCKGFKGINDLLYC